MTKGTARSLASALLMANMFGQVSAQATQDRQAPSTANRIPVSTTVCEVVHRPELFSGEMITVRSRVSIDFEAVQLPALNCDAGKAEGIWLQYAQGPKEQPTVWCCGETRNNEPLVVQENSDFAIFHQRLTAQSRRAYLNDVTATFIGRLDHVAPEPCGPNKIPCCRGGYGHFGMFCSRLVIQSVSNVVSTPARSRVRTNPK
jgi:hypothetical protein